MGDAPSVSLDDFARVTARIQKGVSRDRALADAGIDDDTWFAAQQAWLARMARRVAAGDRRLHDRYLERLRAFEEEDQESQRPLDGDLPKAPDRRMPPKPSARAKRPRKPVPAGVVAPAAMLHASAPAPVVVRTKEPEDVPVRTMEFEIPAQSGSALPFIVSAKAAPPSIPLEEHDAAGETLDPVGDTLPGETLEADTLDAAVETDPAGETLDPDMAGIPREPALPFEDMPTSTLEPEPVVSPAMPFKGPAPGPRKREQNPALPFRAAAEPKPKDEPVDPLSSTQTGDAIKVPSAALPFRSEPGAPKPRSPRAEGGLPFRRPATPKYEGSEGTRLLTSEELTRAARDAPSKAAKKDAEEYTGTVALPMEELGTQPRLTIEQFASLTAEIAVSPRELATLEQRYGLGAGGHDREKRAWAMRFLSEPKLSAEYATKVRQYRAWLARPR
jgi:hypothetical protein